MNRVIYGRTTAVVKLINPSELKDMKEDSLVVVNRIRINSKLVEFEVKNTHKQEIVIIKKAIREMKAKEAKHRRVVMGPTMKVRDIKIVFPEYERLPKNSFALAEV